jgi:hypothetical protein
VIGTSGHDPVEEAIVAQRSGHQRQVGRDRRQHDRRSTLREEAGDLLPEPPEVVLDVPVAALLGVAPLPVDDRAALAERRRRGAVNLPLGFVDIPRCGPEALRHLGQLDPAHAVRRAFEQAQIGERECQHVEPFGGPGPGQQRTQPEAAGNLHRLEERERRRDEVGEPQRCVVGEPIARLREGFLHPRPGVRRCQQVGAERFVRTGLQQASLGETHGLTPAIEVGVGGDTAALHRHEQREMQPGTLLDEGFPPRFDGFSDFHQAPSGRVANVAATNSR